jgi:hypothetical protein
VTPYTAASVVAGGVAITRTRQVATTTTASSSSSHYQQHVIPAVIAATPGTLHGLSHHQHQQNAPYDPTSPPLGSYPSSRSYEHQPLSPWYNSDYEHTKASYDHHYRHRQDDEQSSSTSSSFSSPSLSSSSSIPMHTNDWSTRHLGRPGEMLSGPAAKSTSPSSNDNHQQQRRLRQLPVSLWIR